jgi:uncharacterized glyoxalase superfamily protein PhnB/uncharacterized protein YndB with AHSA1/START domain
MITPETVFTKDTSNKKLTVERQFDAPAELVWQAWTVADILDQWWAPHPFRAVTKKMDFRVGGQWLYYMAGPEGISAWCRVDFTAIEPNKSYACEVSFCDETGNKNPDFPIMNWINEFSPAGSGTAVKVTIAFDREADLQTIVSMGFKEGFTAGLSNLDQYLSNRFRLRQEQKPNNKPRVTTYLNFNGNTEEAFRFYKGVFRGEFTGGGLQRFGDASLPAGHPPLSDADKKLILHAELTILGGHVLMATDAPESMGFNLRSGNNMHINLEPDSRAETKRLFDALAEGGTITMPMEDVFFGAYFGELTDKYGINWMLTFQQAK